MGCWESHLVTNRWTAGALPSGSHTPLPSAHPPPLPAQVGAWIAFSAYQLARTIRRGEISSHPLFCFASDAAADVFRKNGEYELVDDGADTYRSPA